MYWNYNQSLQNKNNNRSPPGQLFITWISQYFYDLTIFLKLKICTKLIRFTDSRSYYYINAGLTICKIQSQSRRKNIASTVKMLPIFFSPLTHNYAVRPGSVRPPVLKVQGPFALILCTCMYYIGMLCTGACFIIFFNTTNNISGMGKKYKTSACDTMVYHEYRSCVMLKIPTVHSLLKSVHIYFPRQYSKINEQIEKI